MGAILAALANVVARINALSSIFGGGGDEESLYEEPFLVSETDNQGTDAENPTHIDDFYEEHVQEDDEDNDIVSDEDEVPTLNNEETLDGYDPVSEMDMSNENADEEDAFDEDDQAPQHTYDEENTSNETDSTEKERSQDEEETTEEEDTATYREDTHTPEQPTLEELAQDHPTIADSLTDTLGKVGELLGSILGGVATPDIVANSLVDFGDIDDDAYSLLEDIMSIDSFDDATMPDDDLWAGL